MKQDTLTYLKTKSPKLCVIATATIYGKPEAAVMGYAVKDDLTMILSTRTITRKYSNLQHNAKVSLVIGCGFSENNVQIDGTARIITEGSEYTQTEAFFFGQNPAAKAFKNSDTIFIEIKPTWIRFMDRTVSPTNIREEEIF